MEFTSDTRAHGFRIDSVEPLDEIDGIAAVGVHEKSGARLLVLKNDDENKSFAIAFKTPPADDTGVFHILEHSVLCGSQKFPVKEPFVNLLRTSMQTFLNALTFPDKTMYPVASTNDQDLLNLIDVYMDAVLNPNIYVKRAIFEQEGWHYELDEGEGAEFDEAVDAGFDGVAPDTAAAEADAVPAETESAPDVAAARRLRYNGVVFNEMKGALSDPESVLMNGVNRALYPDTCYSFESGGHPRSIPQLTYQNFLDTHARHYRLDNAYIVLYGDQDYDAVLGFLDENYLSSWQPREAAGPNPMGWQEPVVNLTEVVPMDTAPENACVGLGYSLGSADDFERVLACDILLDALMGGNESPIKRAILDSGLGGDARAYIIDSQAQPAAMVYLRNAKPDVAEEFRNLVESQAAALAEGGIPRDLLEASLAQMAFDLRERDRGMADGVVLAMNAMAGWLYNPNAATLYLRYEDALAHMRAGLDSGYFEDLLRSVFVESNHKVCVEVRPEQGVGAGEEEAELAQRLAAMDEADLQAVRDDVAALRELQEAPDSPEALATLPQLHVSDIGPAKPDPLGVPVATGPIPYLLHELPTRRIDYVRHYFDINGLKWDDLPYVSLLSMFMGKLGTVHRSAAELDVALRSHLGDLRMFAEVIDADDEPSRMDLKFVVQASAIAEEVENLASMPREVWEETLFDDAARMRDILVQKRISMEKGFANAGHSAAAARVAAYGSAAGVVRQALGGVEFYRFLKDLLAHFDERFDDLCVRLNDVRSRVLVRCGLISSFTGSAEDAKAFWQMAGDFGLADGDPDARPMAIPCLAARNEAFIVPTDVAFAAKGLPLAPETRLSGVWPVAGRVLSYDYLWNEVRVKGGAYGTGFARMTSGNARFYSYRDPNLDSTLARFDDAAEWLASFDPDESEMEGYVVATVATHDAPVKPRQIARRVDEAFFRGRPANYRETMRDQELSTTPEQIRELAADLRRVAEQGAVCVFGNEDIIRNSKADLTIVDLLNE